MKRFALLLIVIGLCAPIMLVKDAFGHGVKKGETILVSTTRTCVTPSKERVTKKYKTKYTLRGQPTPQRAPSDHWHYSSTSYMLSPHLSGFNPDCLTTRRVCRKIKDYHATCGKTKSEADEICNRFAEPWDGREIYATYIKYWRWVEDPNDCWTEIVY